jgi:hypothetical protein
MNNLDIIKEHTKLGALRWLHSIDFRKGSHTYGIADREYWAWKVKDFANGTLQGGISGFLDAVNLLGLEKEEVKKVVDAVMQGTKTIQRTNGSFEEAYPLESSYCVTGLVIYNLLYSYFLYPEYFENEIKNTLCDIVLNSYQFLTKTVETHGLISNHLVTTAGALIFSEVFLQASKKSDILKTVLELQREEGWFPEYTGADPGYQTLLNHYLVGIVRAVPSLKNTIQEGLKSSLDFVSNFCFPDGSFSGEIGSRGTSILYPSGTLSIGENYLLDPTEMTNWFALNHIKSIECVSPCIVDVGNFVPVFNSWSCLFQVISSHEGKEESVPPLSFNKETVVYKEAGLSIRRNSQAMIVVSVKNGAIRKVIQSNKGYTDESITGILLSNKMISGFSVSELNDDNNTTSFTYGLTAPMMKNNTMLTSILLRILSFSVYKFPILQRALKKCLAAAVMGVRGQTKEGCRVIIDNSKKDFPIEIKNKNNFVILSAGFYQHMASANTFLKRALKDKNDS